MRTCVLFHYYEADDSHKDNLLHFLLFGYLEHVDYIIIIAGQYSVELPQRPNIKYVFTENKNNDYGGYSAAILGGLSVEAYDSFAFINSTARGPYIPPYVDADWVMCFTAHLRDDVALVGSTINILSPRDDLSIDFKRRHGGKEPFAHVQTAVFALSQKALAFLIAEKFFSNDVIFSKPLMIMDFEILMSQKLIRAGWNIKCLLPEYNVLDYRLVNEDVNPTSMKGDPGHEGGYFGRSTHPYEVIFVKTNRSLFPMHFLEKISYSMLMRRNGMTKVELGPAVDAYINKVRATRFDEMMPTLQDKVGRGKLDEIIDSINKILSAN